MSTFSTSNAFFETLMIRMLRAKLHGVCVTDADLNYQGSITLDPNWCRLLRIYPLEFVEIWNKNNGARFSTYVILGAAGSRVCCLNGSAARQCQVGDQLIIAAAHYVQNPADSGAIKPRVAVFNHENAVTQVLQYETALHEDGSADFRTVDVTELCEL